MKKMIDKLGVMSVDEKRFSVLVLVLLIITSVICWQYVAFGFIAEGMVTIFLSLVGAIAGINIARDVAQEVTKGKIEQARIEFRDMNNNGIDDEEEGYVNEVYTDETYEEYVKEKERDNNGI